MGQLASEDVDVLKCLCKLTRRKEKADGDGQLVQARSILAEIRRIETTLSPAACGWWSSKSSERLAAELSKFVHEFRWERTSRGWRAFRWIKRRQCYAKKACLNEQKDPTNRWIRAR